jgi:hypothetical protein
MISHDVSLQSARHAYECELVKLMNQYGVRSEAELLSGCITKWSKYHKRRDTMDLKQEVRRGTGAGWSGCCMTSGGAQ